MSKEYINLADICAEKIEDNFIKDFEDLEKNCTPIYQVQATKGNSNSYIMKCGIHSKVTDIIINKFDLTKTVKCSIISKLYSENMLKSLSESCYFPMLKVQFMYSKNEKLVPIAKMLFNFHTFEHHKNRNNIIKYLSDSQKKIKLDGMFSITFHYGGKKMVLKNYKTYIGQMNKLNEMIVFMNRCDIVDILEDIVKKIDLKN